MTLGRLRCGSSSKWKCHGDRFSSLGSGDWVRDSVTTTDIVVMAELDGEARVVGDGLFHGIRVLSCLYWVLGSEGVSPDVYDCGSKWDEEVFMLFSLVLRRLWHPKVQNDQPQFHREQGSALPQLIGGLVVMGFYSPVTFHHPSMESPGTA